MRQNDACVYLLYLLSQFRRTDTFETVIEKNNNLRDVLEGVPHINIMEQFGMKSWA